MNSHQLDSVFLACGTPSFIQRENTVCVSSRRTKNSLSVELAGCKAGGLFPLNGFDAFRWVAASPKVNRCPTQQAPAPLLRVWQGGEAEWKRATDRVETPALKITWTRLLSFLFRLLRRRSRRCFPAIQSGPLPRYVRCTHGYGLSLQSLVLCVSILKNLYFRYQTCSF